MGIYVMAAPVHQMQQYYTLGALDNCSEKWTALVDCLSLKTKRSTEIQVCFSNFIHLWIIFLFFLFFMCITFQGAKSNASWINLHHYVIGCMCFDTECFPLAVFYFLLKYFIDF
jgi:hypothetical protein